MFTNDSAWEFGGHLARYNLSQPVDSCCRWSEGHILHPTAHYLLACVFGHSFDICASRLTFQLSIIPVVNMLIGLSSLTEEAGLMPL